MKIRKILFVTHFSELRFDALRSLLDLKKTGLSHVVLLNVIERKKVAMRRGTGYRKENEIRLREKANIRFIDWAETLFEEGMEVGVHIVVGPFVKQVVKVALTENVDLIVISPEKKDNIKFLFSGSDLAEIMKRSMKPVLVYKDRFDKRVPSPKPFSKLLFAVHWSFPIARTIELIKTVGNIVEQVDVIHVASEKNLVSSSAMRVQKTRKQNRKKLEIICDELETADVVAKSHVYIGKASSEIEKAARECESSMIILGYHKKSSWEERWSSSISKKMIEKTVFPILLVPTDK